MCSTTPLAQPLLIQSAKAKKLLSSIDKEQAVFFKKVFGKKAATPYKFDRVMNLDHFANPGDVADIAALAFNQKFKTAM